MENWEESKKVPWYQYRNSVRTVQLLSGITSIGDYAFCGFSVLESVQCSNNQITRIGGHAFENCTKMNMTIPLSVTYIGDYSFANTGLTLVTVPDTVKYLGKYAFSGCSGLQYLYYLSSADINENAFDGCGSLKYVSLSGGVKRIENYSFQECTSLKTIVIPDSVTLLNRGAFCRSGLTSIYVPSTVTACPYAFEYCEELISATISSPKISEHAFFLCSALKNVTINDTVTVIEQSAFSYCTSLTAVTIPDSVTSIGQRAFGNSGLTAVNIPESMTSIGQYAFSRTELTSIVIPDSVTSIGRYAFSDCQLTFLEIGKNVVSIGNKAFSMNKLLTEVTVPRALKEIGSDVFANGAETITVRDYSDLGLKPGEYGLPDTAVVERYFLVTWENWDGTVILVTGVKYEEFPEYTGDEPVGKVAGYTLKFTGWSPELTSVLGDAAYTAVYDRSANTYSVTFDPNGGELCGERTLYVTFDDRFSLELQTAEFKGKTFTGWYTDPSGGTKIEGGIWNIAGDTVLYAHWKYEDSAAPSVPIWTVAVIPAALLSTAGGAVMWNRVRSGPTSADEKPSD